MGPLIAAAAAALMAANPAGVGARDVEVEAAERLAAAGEALDVNDCAKALTTVRPLVEARMAPERMRAAGLHIATLCELRLDRKPAAYAHALAGTALTESDDALWRLRLAIELDDGRDEAAAATVEAMGEGRGAALNSVPVRWLFQLDRRLKDAGATGPRRRLLSVLAGGGYVPDEPRASADAFRLRLAELLHDAGERDAALGLVRLIEYPTLLIDVSLDPRFRAALPAAFDGRAEAERALAREREAAARRPEMMGHVIEVAALLRLLGRPDEALAELEKLRAGLVDPARFQDRSEQLVWWWDAVSRAHEMAGRFPQAVDALRRAGALQEDGGLNVSQVINLSQLQLAFGRPEEALATLKAFDGGARSVSPYGEMQVVATRGCAKAVTTGPASSAGEIAYARAHAADAPSTLTKLLLCVRDLDGAAASLVGRLGAAETRQDALRELSEFDPPPAPAPLDPLGAGLRELAKRPDVRAAATRAGDTRRFRVQNTNL